MTTIPPIHIEITQVTVPRLRTEIRRAGMAECFVLYAGSDNQVEVELRDANDVAIEDAQIGMTLIDWNRMPVGGIAWPQPLYHQGSGIYATVLGSPVEIERDQSYTAQVLVSSPSRGDATIEALARCEVLD